MKITDEELNQIKSLNSQIENGFNTIGKLEYDKQVIISNIAKARQEMSKLEKDLLDKYGQVSINMQSGEYSQTEKEPTKNENLTVSRGGSK